MGWSREVEALARRTGAHEPGLLGARQSYAVLCPVIDHLPGGPRLLYEVRAARLRQGGEVCFPGGRMESGETPEACALRETEEELSIPRGEIRLLGATDFIANQRNFLLRPVLGLVSPAGFAAMTPSPAEVAETFTVPLSFFRETEPEVWAYDLVPRLPEDFPYARFGIPQEYPWAHGRVEVPFWRYQGHVIWGMTARITRDLIEGL